MKDTGLMTNTMEGKQKSLKKKQVNKEVKKNQAIKFPKLLYTKKITSWSVY